MPELDDETQAEADDSAMPETVPQDEARDEPERKQEQQWQREDDTFGLLILAGENQEDNSESDNRRNDRRPFE
jgi:hypothetical protein